MATAMKKNSLNEKTSSTNKPTSKTTSKKTASVKSTKKDAPTQLRAMPKPQDAIALLRADHKLVNSLFDEYESTRSASKKKELVAKICTELTVHAQVEEEIFYPAVKLALKDKELIPEAIVEHATLKALIAQVEGIEPDGEIFDAKIKVMSEYVKHHVKEEQNEIFPKAKASKLDMFELGEKIAQRKAELLADLEG